MFFVQCVFNMFWVTLILWHRHECYQVLSTYTIVVKNKCIAGFDVFMGFLDLNNKTQQHQS